MEKNFDLEKEIQKYLESIGAGYGGWIDGMGDDDLREIARHFAQWGAEHSGSSEIPNDLEEAARHSEILTYPMPEDGDMEKVFKVQEARVFHEIGFIAGAEWAMNRFEPATFGNTLGDTELFKKK